MDRVVFTKAKGKRGPQRGQYYLIYDHATGSTTKIVCPNCGTKGELEHEINSLGEVSPSVECPTKGCDFHNYIKLEGWGG